MKKTTTIEAGTLSSSYITSWGPTLELSNTKGSSVKIEIDEKSATRLMKNLQDHVDSLKKKRVEAAKELLDELVTD